MSKRFIKVKHKFTGVIFGLEEGSYDPKLLEPIEEEVPAVEEEEIPTVMIEPEEEVVKKKPKKKVTRKKKTTKK